MVCAVCALCAACHALHSLHIGSFRRWAVSWMQICAMLLVSLISQESVYAFDLPPTPYVSLCAHCTMYIIFSAAHCDDIVCARRARTESVRYADYGQRNRMQYVCFIHFFFFSSLFSLDVDVVPWSLFRCLVLCARLFSFFFVVVVQLQLGEWNYNEAQLAPITRPMRATNICIVHQAHVVQRMQREQREQRTDTAHHVILSA